MDNAEKEGDGGAYLQSHGAFACDQASDLRLRVVERLHLILRRFSSSSLFLMPLPLELS